MLAQKELKMIRWINKISINKCSMYWYTSSLGIPPNEFDILKQNKSNILGHQKQ